MPITATTNTQATADLEDAAIDELRAAIRGGVLTPEDPEYDDVRVVYNAMSDRHPALIARCLGPADVAAAVRFAREHDLLIAVRGGGHSVAGHSTCNGGVMIDLSLMRGVHIDPEARTARVGGGAIWKDVDREAQLFGLATPGGVVSETGVAGLTLGGGLGWLRRRHGLSCDNLLSVEIVTATGEVLRASNDEHPDLFWALRGGGGNFGIVTSFEFRLHPVGPEVYMAAPIYAMEDAAEVYRGFRDIMTEVPDEVAGACLIWWFPEVPALPEPTRNRHVAIPAAVYAGDDPEEGERILRPLREMAEPLADISHPGPYTAIQSGFDPFFPKGEIHSYWKSLYLDEVPDEAIDLIAERGPERSSRMTMFNLLQLGGEMGRVGPTETAFAYREPGYMLSIDGNWLDAAETDGHVAWVRAFWEEMQRFATGGPYLNFLGADPDTEDLVASAYGPNHRRLREVKRRYDPENVFHLNGNIRP